MRLDHLRRFERLAAVKWLSPRVRLKDEMVTSIKQRLVANSASTGDHDVQLRTRGRRTAGKLPFARIRVQDIPQCNLGFGSPRASRFKYGSQAHSQTEPRPRPCGPVPKHSLRFASTRSSTCLRTAARGNIALGSSRFTGKGVQAGLDMGRMAV